MEYPYSIKDISIRVKKTEQALYCLMKRNQDFIKQNSRREGRFVKYNQAVLDWFTEYYGAAQDESSQQEQESSQQETTTETAQEDRQEPSGVPDEEMTVAVLRVKLEALERENADLRERLLSVDAERKELLKIVQGTAIASVQKEQLLLPPPRRTIGEKIKGWFASSRHDHSNN